MSQEPIIVLKQDSRSRFVSTGMDKKAKVWRKKKTENVWVGYDREFNSFLSSIFLMGSYQLTDTEMECRTMSHSSPENKIKM